MTRMTSILRLTLFSILSLAAMTSPGAADNKIKSGILGYDVSAGVGLIFTEKQTMNCKFTPLGGGPVDHYTGSIDEVGLSIGATEGGVPGDLRPTGRRAGGSYSRQIYRAARRCICGCRPRREYWRQ